MPEYDDEAERGRGEAVPAVVLTVNPPPSEFVVGVKSNKGSSNGSTPYCVAMSRPRSKGILKH